MADTVKKDDPFCDKVLGDFKADKKKTTKDSYAFSRSTELFIPESYAQKWIDPITFKTNLVHGQVYLEEVKLISKVDGSISFTRRMEPCLKGGVVKIIPA